MFIETLQYYAIPGADIWLLNSNHISWYKFWAESDLPVTKNIHIEALLRFQNILHVCNRIEHLYSLRWTCQKLLQNASQLQSHLDVWKPYDEKVHTNKLLMFWLIKYFQLKMIQIWKKWFFITALLINDRHLHAVNMSINASLWEMEAWSFPQK